MPTVPQAPDPVTFSSLTGSSVVASFTINGTGGASIDSKQIGYGTNSGSPQYTVSSDGSTAISGLANGTKYYFWARVHNSQGWSAWSSVRSITTYRIPDAPETPIVSDEKQTSIRVAFFDNGNGGTPILERRIWYSTTLIPAFTIGGNDVTVTGLEPGRVYRFWSQVRNSVGWSPISDAKKTATNAGAYVLDGSAGWKRAVPYIRDGGIWKMAEGYTRVAGEWKKTV